MRILISLVITLLFLGQAEAGITFKGGQISSSSGNLNTEKPAKRPDLKFNLNDFDSSHLNRKLSKFDAIRFERRIGLGAPLNRVSQWIGLTRRQAIEKSISERTNDGIAWVTTKDKFTAKQLIKLHYYVSNTWLICLNIKSHSLLILLIF